MTEYDPQRGVSVATLAHEYSSHHLVAEHAHGSDQLIYATSGVMEVFSGQSVWLIPPHFALWIPAHTLHRIRMPGPVSMRTLYLRRGLVDRTAGCMVLHVTPLLRELIIETVRAGRLRMRNRYECALRDLLIPQLKKASPMPTFVTLPRERRALAVAQLILRNPGMSNSMAAICVENAVSVRTIERLFLREVGMSFESWRRQVRLTKAVPLLIAGLTVKEVAFEVGYSQPSAFVAMFRRTLGAAPRAWVSSLSVGDR